MPNNINNYHSYFVIIILNSYPSMYNNWKWLFTDFRRVSLIIIDALLSILPSCAELVPEPAGLYNDKMDLSVKFEFN